MPTPKPIENEPLRSALKRFRLLIVRYLDAKVVDVAHKDVIKELNGRCEMDGSYVAALIFSNLIALLGLLSNSVAVVIGAMLISPLMGPIFSFGLSFAMGDLSLARRSARIIAISVAIAVFSAAFLTIISPLKEVTHEILARTRPNIYDLLIAILSGAIGAIALCTRKSYLFTTTGIAIATAVIPPLSVVGYGIGTWQLSMAMGGFLLFFTNLVAIVISSDIVFMLLRFRSSMAEESRYPLSLRLKILGVTLVLISIPLIVTLVNDIKRLNLSRAVEQTLKSHLNLEGETRLTAFSITPDDDAIKILASVNTIREIDASSERMLNNALAAETKRTVELELEQVIVKAGAIKAAATPLKKLPQQEIPVKETLATLHGKSLKMIRDACGEAEQFLAPWPVRECGVTFNDTPSPTTIQMSVGRDFPLTDQERRWVTLAVNRTLMETVSVQTIAQPLLPDLKINDEGVPDQAGEKNLGIVKTIIQKDPTLQLKITYPKGTRRETVKDKKKALRFRDYLAKEIKIPAEKITLKAEGESFHLTVKGNETR